MKENVELCVLLGYCGLYPQIMDHLRSMMSMQDIFVALSLVDSVKDGEEGEKEVANDIVGRVVQIVEQEKNRLGVQTIH